MPEGPECRVYAEGLNKLLQGQSVDNIEIISGRYTNKEPDGFQDFFDALPLKVNSVNVKGKFIWFDFGDICVWNTLGMTGGWTEKYTPNTRIFFEFKQADAVFFNDQRNFGTLKFGMSHGETEKKLDSLGMDLLNEAHDPIESLELFKVRRNRGKTLPEILMNQKNYPGVGNYVKAEALYRARLSPHRVAESLSEKDIINLHECIQDVLKSSYESKQVHMVDYRDMTECGQEFKKVVYKQPRDPKGFRVVAEETKDKRITYWAPEVQV